MQPAPSATDPLSAWLPRAVNSQKMAAALSHTALMMSVTDAMIPAVQRGPLIRSSVLATRSSTSSTTGSSYSPSARSHR
jgi:hypothetical protein